MGKFDDSIVQYRKALSIDPHFVPSHFGIAADLMYLGKPAKRRLNSTPWPASTHDGELRIALRMAVVASDGGKFDKAQQQMDKEYAVAEKRVIQRPWQPIFKQRATLCSPKTIYKPSSILTARYS
jgi:hypothetical protein